MDFVLKRGRLWDDERPGAPRHILRAILAIFMRRTPINQGICRDKVIASAIVSHVDGQAA